MPISRKYAMCACAHCFLVVYTRRYFFSFSSKKETSKLWYFISVAIFIYFIHTKHTIIVFCSKNPLGVVQNTKKRNIKSAVFSETITKQNNKNQPKKKLKKHSKFFHMNFLGIFWTPKNCVFKMFLSYYLLFILNLIDVFSSSSFAPLSALTVTNADSTNSKRNHVVRFYLNCFSFLFTFPVWRYTKATAVREMENVIFLLECFLSMCIILSTLIQY